MIYKVYKGEDNYDSCRNGNETISQNCVYYGDNKLKAMIVFEREKQRAKELSKKNENMRYFAFVLEINSEFARTLYQKSYSQKHRDDCIDVINGINTFFD